MIDKRVLSLKLQTYERLKADETLVDLYRDQIDEEPLTGIITQANANFIMISRVSDDGLSNGVSIVWEHDLTRLRWRSRALESLQQLSAAKNALPFTPLVDLSSLRRIIETVGHACGHVALFTERVESEICFIGEIAEIDEDYLILDEYGALRTRDSSRLLLPLEEITRVDAAGAYEADMAFLAKSLETKD